MTNTPKEAQPEGPFDDAEVIDIYTDAQALDDGFLVDFESVGARFRGLPINRMTRPLFKHLEPFTESLVESFDEMLTKILQAKCQLAQGSEGNTGEIGDIYQIPPNLWLVRNEVGGWTAMYPEDY